MSGILPGVIFQYAKIFFPLSVSLLFHLRHPNWAATALFSPESFPDRTYGFAPPTLWGDGNLLPPDLGDRGDKTRVFA